MKTGLEEIQQERNEQIHKHNRQVKDDVMNNPNEELKKAAVAMLTNDEFEFPEHWNFFRKEKMLNNKSYRQRLIVAGALIAAEIDRLNALEKLK